VKVRSSRVHNSFGALSPRLRTSLLIAIGVCASFVVAGASGGCTAPGAGSAPDAIVIGVASFSHETCTFCPKPTGVEEFEFYGPPLSGADVLGDGGYIGGFVHGASEYQGVDVVGAYAVRSARGGSSGSWITTEAFDKYSSGIVTALQEIDGLDGVYLALHGAMAVTNVPKPEAELVRRVRAGVGDIPIFITYDLHANEDQEIAEAADGVFITKRYPHYDAALQGERAARVLIRTIRGTYSPVLAARKPNVITPSVYQGTGVSPARDIMERARRWENRERDVFVSVAFGFAYADVPDVGATVIVMTNNDQELADRIADDMSDYIWRIRDDFAGKVLPKTREGVAMAIAAAREGKTPVVVADHSDRTGNSTHILEELIRQGGSNFCIATISDSRAIEQIATQAGVGDTVTVDVGGYADEFAGNPVPITGEVEYLGRYGQFDQVAVLAFGDNNHLILTPALHQVTMPGIFERLGLDLDELDIVVLKSRVHFRRGFHESGLAGAIFEVDAPGLGPADLTTITYENIPKDIYPVYQR
jgi:microcystin degradation protein MlrC